MEHPQTEALAAQLTALDLGPAVAPALELATRCNAGRTRPLSDQPYLYHVLEVALQIVVEFSLFDEKATVLALWHDLLEDEQMTPDALTSFIDQHPALQRLGNLLPMLHGLNRHGKTTSQYYDDIAALPPQVFWVKASDLLSNTRPQVYLQWDRLKPRWIAKYTIEIAREVLDVGRFETKRGYPIIRAALLDVQQHMLKALQHDPKRWHEIGALDPRFGAAALDLLARPYP